MKVLLILVRISHKIRRERTEDECWWGFRADSGVKPGRHPAKSRIQGNPLQCRNSGAQQKICEIFGLVLGSLLLPMGASAALSFEVDKITHRAAVEETAYTAVFPFTNAGGEAVEISEVISGCGCTTAMPSQRVFEPGESGEISATFDFGSREGKQVKSIQVVTTSADNPGILLTLEVTIPKTLVATPGVIMWNIAKEPSVQAKTVIIQSHVEDEVDVLEVVSTNERFDHEIMVLEKGRKFSLTIRPPDVSEIEGTMRGTFLVKTSLPNPMKSTKKIYAIIR